MGARLNSTLLPRRLVVILQRGGMDGLHAVPPVDDPHWRACRPTLSAAEDWHALAPGLGLHPALLPLLPLWEAGELAVLPAIATRYRRRSHFEAQNMLESGGAAPYVVDTGWLNRALDHLGTGAHGLSLDTVQPLILRGAAAVHAAVPGGTGRTETDVLERLDALFAPDPLFHQAYRRSPLHEAALKAARQAGSRPRRLDPVDMARAAASRMAAPGGPHGVVIELSGWDTHQAQAHVMRRGLAELGAVVLSLRDGLGDHWQHTAVIAVSEFGRTVAENGTRGTDHGTGGLALVAGGTVRGGRSVGAWGSLRPDALLEGRDVRPTLAMAGLLKAVLRDHFGLAQGVVDADILPSLAESAAIDGLFVPPGSDAV